MESCTEKIDEPMEKVYEFLLTSEECQFTMPTLMQLVKTAGITLCDDTIKNRLKDKFKNQIVISARMEGNTYVCFSNDLYDILKESNS